MTRNGKKEADDAHDDKDAGVTHLVSEVREKGKALLNEGLESAKNIYEDNADALKKKAGEIGDKTVDELSEDLKYYVRHHPLQSVGLALGLGFVIGVMFKE